jgi:acyl carrier protein
MEPHLEPIRQRLRSYVLEQLEPRGIAAITDDASLFEAGIVDSLGVFQLIAFLENSFSIHISDREIELAHFETIDATTRFVASKLGA